MHVISCHVMEKTLDGWYLVMEGIIGMIDGSGGLPLMGEHLPGSIGEVRFEIGVEIDKILTKLWYFAMATGERVFSPSKKPGAAQQASRRRQWGAKNEVETTMLVLLGPPPHQCCCWIDWRACWGGETTRRTREGGLLLLLDHRQRGGRIVCKTSWSRRGWKLAQSSDHSTKNNSLLLS